MEIGSGISIPSTVESRLKSEIIRLIRRSENAYIHEKKQIIAKIVVMPHAMLASSLLLRHIKNIWDFALENVMLMREMMVS